MISKVYLSIFDFLPSSINRYTVFASFIALSHAIHRHSINIALSSDQSELGFAPTLMDLQIRVFALQHLRDLLQ